MTEERLKLHETAEKRINAIIDTLSQDKGGLADKLKQEDVKDFLESFWVDCATEVTKKLQVQMSNCLNCAFWKDKKKYDICRNIKKLGKTCCTFWKLKE